MKDKIILALLLTISISALTACGNSATTDTTASDAAKEHIQTAYSDIVTDIVVGYQTDWAEATPDSLGLSTVYNYESQYLGYLIDDINGDGLSDLIIGENIDGDEGGTIIYDVYTGMADGSVVHLFCGGERDTMHITADGVLVERGSSSADDSFEKAYTISDGELTEAEMPSDDHFETLQLDLIWNYV